MGKVLKLKADLHFYFIYGLPIQSGDMAMEPYSTKLYVTIINLTFLKIKYYTTL